MSKWPVPDTLAKWQVDSTPE
uniref:Uncharacterized protein n=1 Tax=Arundo donax TaxID=35708 RepID=A0A0A8ZXB6_ARUDO